MKKISSALVRSTFLHLALLGLVSIVLATKGGWLNHRLTLGSAHPSALVEIQWSTARGSRSKERQSALRSDVPEPVAREGLAHDSGLASSSLGAESRPSGTIQITAGAPEYPLLSRRAGEQGTVTLGFELRADGTAADIRVETSSGHSRLDGSAQKFLQQAQLPLQNALPAGGRYSVSFVFSLRN